MLQSNKKKHQKNIEDSTIFRKKNEKYNLEVSFDVDKEKNFLYVLNNPHREVFVYDINNSPFKLIKRISLNCKFFTLRLVQNFTDKKWDDRDFYLNSYFRSLNLSGSKKECLITYLYGILIEDGKQVGTEFSFPKSVDNFLLFKDKNTILLTARNYEPENTTPFFYVARLEKIQ